MVMISTAIKSHQVWGKKENASKNRHGCWGESKLIGSQTNEPRKCLSAYGKMRTVKLHLADNILQRIPIKKNRF